MPEQHLPQIDEEFCIMFLLLFFQKGLKLKAGIKVRAEKQILDKDEDEDEEDGDEDEKD